MDIIAKLFNMVRVYHAENGREPNTIYVGYEERDQILKSNESIRAFQTPAKGEEKLFGIDLVEVNKENYLKVGYVSDTTINC